LARVLYIVSRENPALYNHLRTTLQTATVEVAFDRRSADRRQRAEPTEVERRRSERRKWKIDDELRRVGWAEVQIADSQTQ
jgi:hypothetical protein